MHITAKDIQAQREMLERGRRIAEEQAAQVERLRLRDTFAAAALTGLLASETNGALCDDMRATLAYAAADAMLRERERTNHDAAPAAIAHRSGDDGPSPDSHGTGDTPPLAAGGRACGASEEAATSQGSPCQTRGPFPVADGRPAPTAEPVAWAVIGGDGYEYVSLLRECAAEAARSGGGHMLPLYTYPQPTLTGAERVAVEIAADACGNCNGFGGDTRRPALYEGDRVAATLRGLLERLG